MPLFTVHDRFTVHHRFIEIMHPTLQLLTCILFILICVTWHLLYLQTLRPSLACAASKKSALNNLQNNQFIVIKPFEKDGGICIINTKDYLTKIHTYLQDRNKYKPLTYNPTGAIVNDTCILIEYVHSQQIIDKATKAFSLPPRNTCTILLYGLTKINKSGCLLQPFVSGCDSSTDHLTAYITHSIQPLASNLPSHIKDTKHNNILIEKLPPLPSNTLLVTTDVMSQYRNIPHEEGIAAVIYLMEEYKHLLATYCPLPIIVRITFDFILKHRTFKFMDTIYTKSLAPPWELGWLPPMPIYSWERKNAP